MKEKNIFFTGEKGVGKTTILNKIINELNLDVGGYFTSREFVNDGVKFYLNDFITKKTVLMADFSDRENPKVFKDSFEIFAVELIKKALQEKSIIILDEIGNMEESFEDFKNAIFETLESDKIVIGVLKKCESNFVNSIKQKDNILLFCVDEDNRNDVLQKSINLVKNLLNE